MVKFIAFKPQAEDTPPKLKASESKIINPRLTIFDWRNEIYVETGFMQATHYNHPERLLGFQASDKSIVEKARNIYLEDLKISQPYFFLVATTTKYSYWDMTINTIKKIPKLHSSLFMNYTYLDTYDDFEIYIRKDL